MSLIDRAERRRRLGTRHFLARPAPDLPALAGAVVGLHSSDPVTVYLSCVARSADFTPDDLDDELYERRSLVRILGMRRTMFVVPLDLAGVIDSAATKALAGPQRTRLIGMVEDLAPGSPEQWVDRLCDETLAAIGRLGCAPARAIGEEVPELRLRIEFGNGHFGMSTRILFLLATQGRIVRGRPSGTIKSTLYDWCRTEDWLGAPLPDLAEDQARIELVGRWLRAFGPGSLRDLTWWTGWGKTVTRRALAGAGAVEVDTDDGPAFVIGGDDRPTSEPQPWVALLPSLDPTTMGWKDRDWYLDPAHVEELFDRNGNAGPTIWCDGRVVGGWAQRPDGEIATQLLDEIGAEANAAVQHQAAELAAWLGDLRIVPRFRTPLERRLSG